ncbi:hypothetical protein ONS95_009282 [Cadophora gregata]|uniref:uncharacterized protein n=1 Tax=Cadophora gregata TaxID=51156 RepID=UPI0026DB7747|nr:uncharacterized protein ONS95_009282 [Cadophora gregata]KAK0124311.1 hypothetical protein ONS95_009282 [Cadophora gregata]
MSPTSTNTPLLAASKEGKSVWSSPTLSNLTDSQVTLLTDYSRLPLDSVIPHILAIREKAWPILSRLYIGQLRFLDPTLSESPSYPTILAHLKDSPNAMLLDLSCSFGQDLPKFIYVEAPASSLYGAELRSEFLVLGFDCFRDRETIGTTDLDGMMSIVNIGLFLHQFDWDGQRRACKMIVALSRPEKGVLVLVHQIGSVVQSDVVFRGEKEVTRHSEESFKRPWEEVGKGTRGVWEIRVALNEGLGGNVGEETGVWDDADTRRL